MIVTGYKWNLLVSLETKIQISTLPASEASMIN